MIEVVGVTVIEDVIDTVDDDVCDAVPVPDIVEDGVPLRDAP